MKGVGAAAKAGAGMAKGETPYDNAKAVSDLRDLCRSGGKMPSLFPDNSKTGGETTASPKIWEDMNGFKAAFAKFEADAKAAQASVKDVDSSRPRSAAWARIAAAATRSIASRTKTFPASAGTGRAVLWKRRPSAFLARA